MNMTPKEKSVVQTALSISSQFEHVAPEFILELLNNYGVLSEPKPSQEGIAVAQLMQDPDTGKRYVQYNRPLDLIELNAVFYARTPAPKDSSAPARTGDLTNVESEPANKEVPCNSHPKAPHGFNRNASHTAGRYVCDCEGWDAWSAGYDEGMRAAYAAETASEASITEADHLEACTAALARHCAQAGSDSVLYATEYGDKPFAVSVETAEAFNARMQASYEVDWQPAETAPFDEVVLVASEFFGEGDWRIKCGGRSLEKGWQVWGASWTPTFWAKLPANPSVLKQQMERSADIVEASSSMLLRNSYIETFREGAERRFSRGPEGVKVDVRQRFTAPDVRPEGWGPWVAWGEAGYANLAQARAAHDEAVKERPGAKN